MSRAANMDGAEVRVAATWLHDEERLEFWALVRDTDFTTSGVGIGKPFGVTKDLLVEHQ